MLPAISLFTGAGGLDIGVERAGFSTLVSIEREAVRCRTLSVNRPEWRVLDHDIRDVASEEILAAAGIDAGEIALVVGGPPCQPFSKSAFWVPGRLGSLLEDPRAALLSEYIRIVKELRPKAFLMENVFGLAYKTGRPALDAFIQSLSSEGYSVSWKVLNAAKYGVPQKRERLFVIGVRSGPAFRFPQPTHVAQKSLGSSAVLKPYVTAGEAIGDLEDGVVRDEDRVGGKWGHLLDVIPPGENYLHLTKERGYSDPIFKWRSKYWSFLLKLSPTKPSWTIQASPGPSVGPFHWKSRRLRVPEVMRLQTFPDNWKFVGSRRERWAQIGDAVPPLLGQMLGESLVRQVFGGDGESVSQPRSGLQRQETFLES